MRNSLQKNKPDRYELSNYLFFGKLWILLFIEIPFLGFIFFILWRDCYRLNVFIISLVIGLGSMLATIVNYIQPRNPFEGTWITPRSKPLTGEEEKAINFLMASKRVKILITKIGVFLLLQPLALVIINFLFPRDNIIHKPDIAVSIGAMIGSVVFYFLYSLIFYSFVLERYLINNWEEIQKMNIDSYKITLPSWLYHTSIKPEVRPSILTELSTIDAKTPFSWSDFGALIIGFISIILVWSAFETIFRSSPGIGIAKGVFGFILFQAALRLWRIKHKSKK